VWLPSNIVSFDVEFADRRRCLDRRRLVHRGHFEARNPGLGGVGLDIQRSIDDQNAPNSRWCCAVLTNARYDISYVIRPNMVIQVGATSKAASSTLQEIRETWGEWRERIETIQPHAFA
jgi:hypothetical protein